MVEEFVAFIQKQQLFSAKDKLLLAVSGGTDSVVLADLCHRAGYSFAIAHCNFQLRGQDSEEDVAFVRAVAVQYGVECMMQTFDTAMICQETGESVQMVARRLRYQWFDELLASGNYQYIATAHHKNDVLETMLFNLAKGTGIAGLRGMPTKSGALVRPMLFAEKSRINAYIEQHQLPWREDSSNASIKYARNLIRHTVVPRLLQINPSLFRTLDDTLERLQGTEQVLQQYVQDISARCTTWHGQDVWLAMDVLRQAAAMPLVLAEILKPFGFSYEQAKHIAGHVQHEVHHKSGKRFVATDYTLNIDRKHLIISPVQERLTAEYTLAKSATTVQVGDICIQTTLYNAKDYRIRAVSHIAALDADKLIFPLCARRWQAGDWFHPLGMRGRKKLSDFLIDQKTPLHLKNQVQVLLSGEDIAWVIGYRMDDRYKLSAATKEVFEVEMR